MLWCQAGRSERRSRTVDPGRRLAAARFLRAALGATAALVRADVGLPALTIDLAAGLAPFARDLGPLWQRVSVLTVIEFGRRADENGGSG